MPLLISMPLFSEFSENTVAAITEYLSNGWDNIFDITNLNTEGNTYSFNVGDSSVVVGDMCVPLPWEELEGPCATSVLWPNVAEELANHQFHQVVTVSDDRMTEVELSGLLTQITASIMATNQSCLGVYWGNATMVIPKNLFIDFATQVLPEGPPVHIWVDFRVGPDENDTSTGFTTGLTALGLMEIEAIKTPEPYNMLRDRLTGLADYLIVNGPVIQDGNTVGEDDDEKIVVKYEDSQFGYKEQVLNLKYSQAKVKKSQFKFW